MGSRRSRRHSSVLRRRRNARLASLSIETLIWPTRPPEFELGEVIGAQGAVGGAAGVLGGEKELQGNGAGAGADLREVLDALGVVERALEGSSMNFASAQHQSCKNRSSLGASPPRDHP
jgi:hypothetical protein